MAMATLERLVAGFYVQAVQLAAATGTDDAAAGPDAALALYLAKSDPLMVLRDLLGHSSVLTTEAYLRRLDMTRIYAKPRVLHQPGEKSQVTWSARVPNWLRCPAAHAC
jgi:hypothetical protein